MRHWKALALAVCLTVIAATAWGYWSVESTTGSNGAAAASTVEQGATPTASAVTNDLTVSWAPTTLANGQAVSGYRVARFDAGTLAPQTILGGCTGTLTTTTCTETDVPDGSWQYAITPVIGTSWVGPESAKSAPVTSDGTPPVNAITLSSVTGGAALSGATLYYRGVAAGSLRVANAVTDTGTGPASSATALSGTTAGFTHTGSTVSTPSGGPYVSDQLSWAAGTTSAPDLAVTGRDVAGNTALTTLSLVNDSTAPSAGSITYADGFAASRSVSVSFTTGTDAGSGIESRRLQRSAASLTDGSTCGTYGGFTDVAVDPTSPHTVTGLASGCYKFRYVVTDRVGNQDIAVSPNVAKVGYSGAVDATAGLLSHWRLGESSASLTAYDSFTGTSGSALAGRSSDVGGGAWVHQTGLANAVIDTGRVRRNGLSGYTIDYSNITPSSANYSVEADLVVRSALAGDMVGVIGRHNSATNTFYMARWEQFDTSWNLVKYTNGSVSYLNYVANQPALTVNEAYRVRLEMIGSALKLYVNGVETVSATDATITAAGRAGIMDGENGFSGAKSATTGMHLDNFQVTPSTYPRAADTKGVNPGDYKHGVTLGVTGALASDSNAAAQLDGVNDHIQVAPTSGFPVGAAVRSTEMWFKTSSAARQVLFRYGSGGNAQEYGLWIDASGATMTAWGWGSGNDKVFTMPAAVNNGAWHHVVLTYSGTALTLYIDGAALPSQAVTRGTVMDMYGFGIGAVIRPSDGNSGGFFSGAIDEVSFYSTALSAGTVAAHHELGVLPGADLAGPTGGSVAATGLVGTGVAYSTSTTLNLTFSKGTDPSGVAATGAVLRRAAASLTNGACGTFGSYTTVTGGTDPVSPMSETVDDQACYRYEYVVQDTIGNNTTYTSGDIKVDTTAPSAPALTFSAFTNTYWSGTGSTVYYRSTASSGGFTTTALATDPASGIASYAFPALGTGWTSTPGALGVTTYSWSGAPAAPGTKDVTATNNATLTSGSSPFTLTADTTAPGAGTVTYAGGSTTGGTVSVSFTTGTDAGSGVGTRLLQRASAPLTGITCGTFGAFTTVVNGTNPTSPVVDTVTGPSCYKYQYVVSDQVGNEHTATSANVAHTPYDGHWTLDQGTGTSATDSSGNANHGTLGGAASWTTGKVGPYAVNLTGASTSLVDVTNTVVDTSTSYTASAWVKPSSLSGFRTIVSIDGTSISPFYLQMVNGQFTFTTRNSDSTSSVATSVTGPTAVVGTWYHVAGVHDSADGTIKLYVNGVLQGSAAFASPWRATGHTLIGRAKWNGAAVDFLSGAVDDVRLTGRALSAGDVAALAVDPTYSDTVSATSGLAGYWRLGETTTSSDTFTGTAGATLQSRSGEIGASWTKHVSSSADAVLTSAGRLRKSGTTTFAAVYHTTTVPATPDYTVEADVYVASAVTNDQIGVVGRLDPTNTNGTFYTARYELAAQRWVLYSVVNGATWTWLGTSPVMSLSAGSSYRLSLAMNGSAIRVLVNGVQQVSVVDTSITAAGRGGVALGLHGSQGTTIADGSGMHLDNFAMTPRIEDSAGTNPGMGVGGITLGIGGAPFGEANTSAVFDGVNDSVVVPDATALKPTAVSVEAWVKPNAGIPNYASVLTKTTANAWSDGYGMYALSGGIAFWVNDDIHGTFTAALPTTSWSHVVGTYDGATVKIYLNGALVNSLAYAASLTHSSSPLLIGDAAGTANYRWRGGLDEVAVYSRGLTATEVAQHFAAGQ